MTRLGYRPATSIPAGAANAAYDTDVESPASPRAAPAYHFDFTRISIGAPSSQLEPPLSSSAEEHKPAVQAAAPAAISRQGNGQPLEPALRGLFESRFSHDFGDVRIHRDDAAGQMASAHAAAAYTTGEDVWFAPGRYQPASRDGLALLVHELAHTVQQSAAARAGAAHSTVSAPSDVSAEIAAAGAAERVLRGQASGALSPTPLAIARQTARKPKGSTGRLTFDPHWSYIVYDSEVRLRYHRKLSKDEAAERAKKKLPGFVQVGAIPWITNSPGNITQTRGAPTSSLEGFPASKEIGSLGIYDDRYAIFESTAAGARAIGPYLRKWPSLGTNPDLTLASTIRQYKGEEASEKAKRIAREKENAERRENGQPPLPVFDVRETYLADVIQRSIQRMVAQEALEGGESVDQLTPKQLRELQKDAKQRLDALLNSPAKDVRDGDETMDQILESIHEVEGKAAAPGVRFAAGAFIDPTGTAPYDGEQKSLIRALIASAEAKRELQDLLGGSP